MYKQHGVIYLIRNIINNKVYIGQTIQKNPYTRINRHFIKSCKKSPLRNSIMHHGRDNFEITILISAFSQDDLNFLEKTFIKEYDCQVPNGYNIKDGGGQGGALPKSLKLKLSKKAKEWYKYNKHPSKGKKFSKEHVEKLSKVRKGFTSKARKEAHKLMIKKIKIPIEAIHIETKKVHRFESITDCANKLNLQGYNISRVINNKQGRKQHKGYTFKKLPKK